MVPSIRTFLLINLLLSVTFITSLAIVANLFLAHQDIQAQLDAQLIDRSLQMRDVFSNYSLEQRRLTADQQRLIIAELGFSESSVKYSAPSYRQGRVVEFQVWNQQGELVLRSPTALIVPFSDGKTGLSTLRIAHHFWRVNTLADPQTGLTLMLAERLDTRQALENRLTKDSIMIMLITYPFLGCLIWIIVGRGLYTLKKVTKAVSHRAPSNLKPVSPAAVPAEIKPLIIELNSLFLRLKEAFERETRFTADAAHELKTPLAALSAQIQVALRAQTMEERNQALFKVLSGVNRSTHLVQQLLTLNRMLPEATIENPSQFSLTKRVIEVSSLLAPEAIAKNIEFELLTPNVPALIFGNPTAIDILIRNIIDNSIRYTKEQGRVQVKTVEHKDYVALHVIDNGPGISKELRDHVFERFFRVRGHHVSGSGLGLSIAQQIAKLHRATIHMKTPEWGQGLELELRFPTVWEGDHK